MKNNKIIITASEAIFLEFCKTLEIKDIKTNEDIIIATKPRKNGEGEEELLIVVHGKSVSKTVDFIKSSYILIDKIIITNSAKILSNGELQDGDVIVPNTFIGETGDAKFLETTIGEDYDLKKFGLVLSGICSDNNRDSEEFQADIVSEGVYNYLSFLEKEELLSKTTVILQIGELDYTNLIAVSDMSI